MARAGKPAVAQDLRDEAVGQKDKPSNDHPGQQRQGSQSGRWSRRYQTKLRVWWAL